MPEYGLGRREALDPRDAAYPLRAAIRELPNRTIRYYHTGPVLDQGATGTCVGHAWRQWLSSAHLMTKGGPDAYAIYRDATRRDPWPENDNGDLSFGTSVRAGAQALQAAGHLAEYRWSSLAYELCDWILGNHGTVVMGTIWTEGMFTPDPYGVLQPSGRVVGGHAYLLVGYSEPRGAFRMVNSWGRSWGEGGRAWLLGEDLQRLLDEQGEACVGTEQKR